MAPNDWNVLRFNQILSTAVLLEVMVFMFGNYKYNNISIMLGFLFLEVCGYYSNIDHNEDFPYLWIFLFSPPNIVIMIGQYIFGRHIPQAIGNILKKKNIASKFKQIFDNLDETIFIINK